MKYDPQDPKRFEFYQTYDDESGSAPSRRGRGYVPAIVLLLIVAVLLAALVR